MTTVPRDYQADLSNIAAYKPTATDSGVFETETNIYGGNTVLQGSIARTSTAYGKTATVKAGEDIRPALESLKSAGGGTLILLAGVHTPTYDIVGDSKINIVGEGIDQTIVDFGSAAYGVKFIGTKEGVLDGFSIKDLTVQNSGKANAINIEYCDYWQINNIRSTSNDTTGLRVTGSRFFFITNSRIDNNGDYGVHLESQGDTGRDMLYFSIQNCVFESNTDYALYINAQGDNNDKIRLFSIYQCTALNNTTTGFELNTINSSDEMNSVVLQCFSENNGGHGFNIGSNYTQFIGCVSSGNSLDGFNLGGRYNSLFGCIANDNTGADIDYPSILARRFSVIGCILSDSDITNPSSKSDPSEDNAIVSLNLGSNEATEKKIKKMLNDCGANITAAGVVVIYKGSSDGQAFDVTTTVGDDFILGVTAESIDNGDYGYIQTEGITKYMRVNGTTDIAIGDFLSAYSTSGIAAKASPGDMVFAIALEAYTADDSNGVIDALLITPRKI